MATLRDAQTSEIVFEGTPLECVVHARELGGATVAPQLGPGERWECPAELIYDDVGLAFDPDAVLQAAKENALGLEAASADAELDREERERLGEHASRAAGALEAEPRRVREASAAIEAARAQQAEALGQ